VKEGETGTLIVTALLSNNVTPFLRWSSGDLVSYSEADDGAEQGEDATHRPSMPHVALALQAGKRPVKPARQTRSHIGSGPENAKRSWEPSGLPHHDHKD